MLTTSGKCTAKNAKYGKDLIQMYGDGSLMWIYPEYG